MIGPLPTAKGWYPDPATGGTKYWDGERWSGDTRPRRRPFAPACSFGPLGYLLLFLAVMWALLSYMAFQETQQTGYIVGAAAFLLFSMIMCVYFQRGQGPSTAEVERRLADERKAAKARRRAANVASVAATLGRVGKPSRAAPASNHSAAVAQINAISDPRTAQALQNLQNLLFTRAITDDEFFVAKNKLFGPSIPTDAFAHIEKLSELHRAGVLGDVEFAAAKAKALGI